MSWQWYWRCPIIIPGGRSVSTYKGLSVYRLYISSHRGQNVKKGDEILHNVIK